MPRFEMRDNLGRDEAGHHGNGCEGPHDPRFHFEMILHCELPRPSVINPRKYLPEG
jgi:hypothetical protein